LEKRFNLKEMTQIQDKAIPAILSGQDCFIKSQTGSGKTLAYAVPIVQKLQAMEPKLKRNDGIKALVLVPTREVNNSFPFYFSNFHSISTKIGFNYFKLAIQTCQVFEQLCKVNSYFIQLKYVQLCLIKINNRRRVFGLYRDR
jgi:Rad3-related DNA helicase